jgi:hypothetical protein
METAGSEVKAKRGGKTTFGSLSIPVGSELIFKNKPEIKCVTVDAVNMVEIDGEKSSISSLASKVNGYPSSGYHYFTFGGTLLSKMRGSSEVGVSAPLGVGPEAVDGVEPEAGDDVEPALPPSTKDDEFNI